MVEYRYHGSVGTQEGRNALPVNPCRLLDFSLLRLAAGGTWSGDTGDREILAVILGGTATFTVNGQVFAALGQRKDVFSGKPYSVYIPCGATVSVEALSAVEIALPS